MNKIYTLIGIVFLGFIGLNSCSDSFLDVDSTVDIPNDQFYTSEEKLINSLMPAYHSMQWPDWAYGQYNPLIVLGDIMGEDVFPGGATPFDNEHWHRMSNFNANADFTPVGLWKVAYDGVNSSNIVLENIDKVNDVSVSVKNRVRSEALTLRAYYYSILWKYWGNIPYFDKNPSQSPYLEKQLSADEVYTNIMKDLKTVIESNTLPASVPPNELGRFTQSAAQMLRANVVMYQGDLTMYPTVLSDIQSIINSNQYQLMSNFASIWEDAGEWGSESIFEVNYTDESSARTWGNPYGAGGSPTPTLIGMYGGTNMPDYDDVGWGFGPINKTIYDLYDAADQRKDGGILNFEKYKLTNPSASYSPRYQNTGFFNKKYLPRKGGSSKAKNDNILNYRNNYRVYRFAETLLIASELLVRTGGSQTDADTYLNTVRARAYSMGINDPAFAPYKRAATLDNLLEENRLEFVGEGHRYWDLVRFGKAEQILGTRNYSSNKKYLPIPREDIDKSQGTLTQNPY